MIDALLVVWHVLGWLLRLAFADINLPLPIGYPFPVVIWFLFTLAAWIIIDSAPRPSSRWLRVIMITVIPFLLWNGMFAAFEWGSWHEQHITHQQGEHEAWLVFYWFAIAAVAAPLLRWFVDGPMCNWPIFYWFDTALIARGISPQAPHAAFFGILSLGGWAFERWGPLWAVGDLVMVTAGSLALLSLSCALVFETERRKSSEQPEPHVEDPQPRHRPNSRAAPPPNPEPVTSTNPAREAALREQLRKVLALAHRTTFEGERRAAFAAAERIRRNLQELGASA